MQYLDGSTSKTYTVGNAYTGSADIIGLKARGQVIILLDYTKGTDAGLEVKIEKSPAATGSGTWFQTCEITGAGPALVVQGVSYTMGATGKYQIALPCVLQEQRMRIQIRGTGGSGGSGTVIVTVVDDSQFSTDPKLNPTLTA